MCYNDEAELESGMVRKNSTVTLKDIAQELGLSVKAVSTGLNGTGRLSLETRKKIQEAARRMGYTPNVAARSLVTHRSSFIGVLVPYLNSSFFGNIIAGIEEVAGEHDFTLLLDSLDCDENRQRRVLSRLMQRNVDGIILYPQRHQLGLAESLKAIGVPVIQVMNHFAEFGEYAVMVDNLTGGREATEHLIGLGHRKIGFIGHDDESPELVARHRGFDAAMPGASARNGVLLQVFHVDRVRAGGGAGTADGASRSDRAFRRVGCGGAGGDPGGAGIGAQDSGGAGDHRL